MPIELLRYIVSSDRKKILNEVSPAADLAHFVASYTILSKVQSGESIALNDGVPTIVVLSSDTSVATFTTKQNTCSVKGAWFCGQYIKNSRISIANDVEYLVIIRLQPTILKYITTQTTQHFRGRPAFELQHLFGKQTDKLLESFSSVKQPASIIRSFERFVRRHYMKAIWRNSLLEESVDLIRFEKGNLEIQSVAKKLKVSYKWLERNFKNYIGVSPKEYARMQRIINIYDNLKSSRERNLLSIAIENGLYDENHLIKEFKVFFGETPNKYLNTSRR
jgi:AraC-like DNA-binding protein